MLVYKPEKETACQALDTDGDGIKIDLCEMWRHELYWTGLGKGH